MGTCDQKTPSETPLEQIEPDEVLLDLISRSKVEIGALLSQQQEDYSQLSQNSSLLSEQGIQMKYELKLHRYLLSDQCIYGLSSDDFSFFPFSHAMRILCEIDAINEVLGLEVLEEMLARLAKYNYKFDASLVGPQVQKMTSILAQVKR